MGLFNRQLSAKDLGTCIAPSVRGGGDDGLCGDTLEGGAVLVQDGALIALCQTHLVQMIRTALNAGLSVYSE